MKTMTLSLVMAVVIGCLFCGCDNTPVGWLKTDGGYINLNQVGNIESYGMVRIGDQTVLDGPLSEENLKKVRNALKKADKDSQVEMLGYIKFDKDYVMSLTDLKTVSRADAMKIVDDWAEVMDRIASQLP